MLERHPRPRPIAIRIAALTVLALALYVSGCARSTPTPEPVTITFAHPNYDSAYYQQLVALFSEAYPYITVELRPRNWDMLGGLGAGDAQVFITSQFAMSWMYEQGSVLNLTPFLEQDESFDQGDYYPGTLGLYAREGKTWGIPAGVDLMVMYYNQDLFDQYRLDYPRNNWTWDDFLVTAATLRDPAADTFGYVPAVDVFDALTFVYQHGGRIFDDLANPTRTTFDDPLTIEALEWYADLYFEHDVAPTSDQMRQSFASRNPRMGILLGRVGMWNAWLSERGGQTWTVDWDMRWGIAPLPQDEQSIAFTLVHGYFISAQSQHPDACWKWIAFLSQQPPSFLAPVRRSLVESSAYEDRVGPGVASVVRASMDDVLLLSPRLAEYEESLEVFIQAFGSMMEQASTPAEAMNWAQQQSKLR